MTKKAVVHNWGSESKPLGLLCRRLEFPTFHEMVTCLIEVDSTVEVIYSGVAGCIISYHGSESKDYLIYPGSRGKRTLILLGILVNANINVTEYDDSNIFRTACHFLKGELGVAVLSFFLTKDSTGVKSVDGDGFLSIHNAAIYSSLDVLKLLQKTYPASISMLTNGGENLLHLAFFSFFTDIVDDREKVQYLCDQCPAFIHETDNDGRTPLHYSLLASMRFNIQSVICLCNADETVVRDKYTPADIDDDHFGQLPLHLLIADYFPRSELSNEGDCFRLFLRLYPASAGIRIALVQEDKMRCHILNCLAALTVVQIRRKRQQKTSDNNEKHELVTKKVFGAACSVMIDTEFDNNEVVVTTVLSAFPDDSKMSDERTWLPLHFAIALFEQKKISAEDVHLMHATDVLAMYHLSDDKERRHGQGIWIGGRTSAHLLCMQKEPNLSMVRYFCLRDPKAFLFCDQSGRCALPLAAQYSERVEQLQAL